MSATMQPPPASAPTALPRPWWKRVAKPVWRVLRLVLVILLVATVLGSIFQERLIFPGATMTHGVADKVLTQPPTSGRLVELKTGGGERVVGLFGPASTGPHGMPAEKPRERPTILYFYGNAECLADTAAWAFRDFRDLGANVMLVEYVGYGGSSGSPSEAGCYAAADAAYNWLVGQPEVDPRRIVVGGWSLGAAVACDLAVKKPVAGLFMFSAFTSLDDVAGHHYWFLPTGLVLRHHFYSERKIHEVTVPVLIGHGQRDPIIPFAMSARLRAAVTRSPQVTYLPVPDAEHNDFYEKGQAEVYGALRKFLDGLSVPPATGERP